MEIKIGMKSVAREINMDIDKTQDELKKQLTDAMNKGEILELVDKHDAHTLVNTENIAYIEFAPERQNRVGFSI